MKAMSHLSFLLWSMSCSYIIKNIMCIAYAECDSTASAMTLEMMRFYVYLLWRSQQTKAYPRKKVAKLHKKKKNTSYEMHSFLFTFSVSEKKKKEKMNGKMYFLYENHILYRFWWRYRNVLWKYLCAADFLVTAPAFLSFLLERHIFHKYWDIL